jgi:ArsR family metal-binding transcriptional regulator
MESLGTGARARYWERVERVAIAMYHALLPIYEAAKLNATQCALETVERATALIDEIDRRASDTDAEQQQPEPHETPPSD